MKEETTKNYYIGILVVGILLIGLSVLWPKSPTSAFVGQMSQYDFFTDQHHIPPTPHLFINHEIGRQGSYFHITGTNYPVLNTVIVTVNGELVGTASVGSHGVTQFQLSTDNADDGVYFVKVTAAVDVATDDSQTNTAPVAEAVFAIRSDAPFRAPTQGAETLVVPEGIASSYRAYLPAVIR